MAQFKTEHQTRAEGECTPRSRDRCVNARNKGRCICQCGGANHGRNMRDRDQDENMAVTSFKVFEGVQEQTIRTLAPGANMDIVFSRGPSGRALVNIPQSLVYHSPTGFEWGYGGSGPAELALNILNLYVKPPEAFRLHQQFKEKFIVGMPNDGGVLKADKVREWIKETWDRERVQRILQLDK